MYNYTDSVSFGGFKEVNDLSEQERENWYIVNVSKQSRDDSDVHISLNDGIYDGGNSQEAFAEAVNAVRKAIRRDKNVFVHCAIGQSRSVSVLATAVSAESDESFETILEQIVDIRGSFTEPASSLKSKAEVYLRHTS